MTTIQTPKGNGQTGYWKLRGFFVCYVNGHKIGTAPTPEQAKALIAEIQSA